MQERGVSATSGRDKPTLHNAYTLDRSSAMPLYHQLFIDLRRRLLGGEWKPGDVFPKDSEIEDTYGVSRITVRQAVANLVDGNFVVRFRGRGSFVGNLPREGAQANHRIVAEEIAARGGTASHRHMSYEVHPVSDVTARQLEIDSGAQVGILKRLHLSDGVPFCLEWIMLSIDTYPAFFDAVIAERETLTEAYRRFGIEVMKCDQTVNAVMLSEERRRELGLPDGAPALFIERIGYSSANHPLDVRRLYYRSDIFALRQEIIWGSAEKRIV